MKMCQFNIGCVSLTKTLFEEHVLNADGVDYNLFLVSPVGNIFLIGNPDDIEEIDIDAHHVEYTIIDAGDVQRKILFHGEDSNYGILLNEMGTPNSSTGMIAAAEDPEDWKDTVKWETGQLGQDLSNCSNESFDESTLEVDIH